MELQIRRFRVVLMDYPMLQKSERSKSVFRHQIICKLTHVPAGHAIFSLQLFIFLQQRFQILHVLLGEVAEIFRMPPEMKTLIMFRSGGQFLHESAQPQLIGKLILWVPRPQEPAGG